MTAGRVSVGDLGRRFVGVFNETTVDSINALVRFCARRDVPVLTRDALEAAAGAIADVAILFGGTIVAGADVFADAMREQVASHYMIVGGQGHTTGALRRTLRDRMGWDDAESGTEAALLDRYLRERHGLAAGLLEHDSANCGSNARNAVALLRARRLPHDRLILVQDATMQQRTDAAFRRYVNPATRLINYASHQTTVTLTDGLLTYAAPPEGMWPVDRYIAMLMGEVPRLADDANGYGPAGRGYIAHVDVPAEVRRAFSYLRETTAFAARPADPQWAG
jgi:uncharacterized SAM-binding protein YcdF (DUF218 family)